MIECSRKCPNSCPIHEEVKSCFWFLKIGFVFNSEKNSKFLNGIWLKGFWAEDCSSVLFSGAYTQATGFSSIPIKTYL